MLPATAEVLRSLGREAGAEAASSPIDPFLQELATAHAEWMARRGQGGHQGWKGRGGRFEKIQAEFGLVLASEIVAYSSTLLVRAPMDDCAANIWATFQQSRGHWGVAAKVHRLVGLEMAKSRRGIWYAAVIVVD